MRKEEISVKIKDKIFFIIQLSNPKIDNKQQTQNVLVNLIIYYFFVNFNRV
jgi:hypothetical protein